MSENALNYRGITDPKEIERLVYRLGNSSIRDLLSDPVVVRNTTILGEDHDYPREKEVITLLPQNRYLVLERMRTNQPEMDAYLEDGDISHLTDITEVTSTDQKVYETARKNGVRVIFADIGEEETMELFLSSPRLIERAAKGDTDFEDMCLSLAFREERDIYIAERIKEKIPNYMDEPILIKYGAFHLPPLISHLFLSNNYYERMMEETRQRFLALGGMELFTGARTEEEVLEVLKKLSERIIPEDSRLGA